MMLALLGLAKTAGGFLKSLPWQAYAGLAAAAFIWWYGGHQFDRGYDKRTAEYAEIARQAQLQADKADKTATATVKQSKSAVEAVNDKAREAARDSNDPLRDGLGALRD